MFYSESVGRTAIDAACARRLATQPVALAEFHRTLALAQLRLVAAHHHAICSVDAPRARRPRGARRVSLQTLRWHQQMRRLDSWMLAPARPAPLRGIWSLTRVLAGGWSQWIRRSATAASRELSAGTA